MIRQGIILFLKGMAMGAANVIPGVSGGTIAFITGIYETFIHSLKSFDAKAIQYLLRFKLRKFSEHVNLPFLIVLGLGIIASLLSLGRLLDYLFSEYPEFVWSFFFGLIAISIFSVGREIKKWNISAVSWFIIGTAIAVVMSFMTPATENSAVWYLVLCGVVAMASMILPGLSGSFVLILMGNYQLIMLRAVPGLDWNILVPVVLGAVLGFVLLSRIISFFLDKYHDGTISTLTGFILGSLLIIWPWKNEVYLLDDTGAEILKDGQSIVSGYEWYLPGLELTTIVAVGLMIAGIGVVLFIEKLGKGNK